MENQEEHIHASPSLVQETESGIIGILIGIIFVVMILLALNYFTLLQLSRFFPILSFLPHKTYQANQTPAISSDPLEKCPIQKEGNPLVETTNTSKGRSYGTFRGVIRNISVAQDAQSLKLELVSENGLQSHTFSIHDINNRIIDVANYKPFPVSGLRAGETVLLSYDCNPETGNVFTIYVISVVNH